MLLTQQFDLGFLVLWRWLKVRRTTLNMGLCFARWSIYCGKRWGKNSLRLLMTLRLMLTMTLALNWFWLCCSLCVPMFSHWRQSHQFVFWTRHCTHWALVSVAIVLNAVETDPMVAVGSQQVLGHSIASLALWRLHRVRLLLSIKLIIKSHLLHSFASL